MKRSITITLALILTLSLTACSHKAPKPSAPESETPQAETVPFESQLAAPEDDDTWVEETWEEEEFWDEELWGDKNQSNKTEEPATKAPETKKETQKETTKAAESKKETKKETQKETTKAAESKKETKKETQKETTKAAETQKETQKEIGNAPSKKGTFIFKDSNTRLLTDEDLEGVSAADLRLGRNEIFARLGRKFKDKKLQAYFDDCDWYKGTLEPDKFDKQKGTLMNKIEKKNVKIIQYAEKLCEEEIPLQEETGWAATWELVQKYPMNDQVLPNTSVLGFIFDNTLLYDFGPYYLQPVTISKIATIDHKLANGEEMELVIDELTGQTITLTGDGDIIKTSDNWEFSYVTDDEGTISLFDANGSDDPIYIPFAKGTLRILAKSPAGYFGEPEFTVETMKDSYHTNANGVSFDKDGYVTGLLFYGD